MMVACHVNMLPSLGPAEQFSIGSSVKHTQSRSLRISTLERGRRLHTQASQDVLARVKVVTPTRRVEHKPQDKQDNTTWSVVGERPPWSFQKWKTDPIFLSWDLLSMAAISLLILLSAISAPGDSCGCRIMHHQRQCTRKCVSTTVPSTFLR